mmetsp:Transcript_8098/g.23898  ORF Transcript_8098/g.23898 Transcript_8098/m.23898 type:complete len:491 (-) Transcript_8098:4493-5965(-)
MSTIDASGAHPDELDPRLRSFWSCSLEFGEAVPWNPLPADETLQLGLSLTQIAVAPTAKGKHVIICTVAGEEEDQTSVLATLDATSCPQQRVKLHYGEPAMFALVQGEGPVHLTGTEVLVDTLEDLDLVTDEDALRLQLLEDGLAEAADGKSISKAAQEILQNAAVGEVDRLSKSYIGSALELADLVQNYQFCAGSWDLILKFQAGSTDDDLERYKEMMAELIDKGHVEKFTKKEQAARRKELAKLDTEISLEEEENNEDEDEDNEEETDADRAFIDDSVDDEGAEADPIAMAEITKGKAAYSGTSQELRDLILNFEKCAGQWDLIDRFQPGLTKETLPRFKKMIKKAAKRGQVSLQFSKAERAAAREAIETEAYEDDLEDSTLEDEDEDDNDEDDDITDADRDFIAGDESDEGDEDEYQSSEDEVEEDEDEDDDDRALMEIEKSHLARAFTPKSKLHSGKRAPAAHTKLGRSPAQKSTRKKAGAKKKKK